MEKEVNRVIQAWQGWEPLKQQYEQALGEQHRAHEKDLAKMQLDYLHQCQHRLKGNVTSGERVCLRLLDSVVRKLEKQVYPNLLQRLYLQVKNVVYDRPNYLAEQVRQRERNMEELKQLLKGAGLETFAGRLEKHLHTEDRLVRVTLESQVGAGKQLNVDLHFRKDSQGNFQLPMLLASLWKKGDLEKQHVFEFKDWPGIKTSHIFNLLEGRAVNQQYTNATGHQANRWLELGENGLRTFDRSYGYDLRKSLADLPVAGNKAEILALLEQGNKVTVGSGPETIHLTANPSGKDIRLDKKQAVVKQLRQEQPNQVRKGVKHGHGH
jgi:hypothetical protein